MLAAVAKALNDGYAVLITNPNQKVSSMETPEQHLLMIWDHYLNRIPTKNICFWADGYGCKAIIHVLDQRGEKAEKRITSIAFVNPIANNIKNREWGLKHVKQWNASDKALDEKIITIAPRTQVVSGGTDISAKIHFFAFGSIFSFFAECCGVEKKKKMETTTKGVEKSSDLNVNEQVEIEEEISESEGDDSPEGEDEDLDHVADQVDERDPVFYV
jgi:hypothetical protein